MLAINLKRQFNYTQDIKKYKNLKNTCIVDKRQSGMGGKKKGKNPKSATILEVYFQMAFENLNIIFN